MRYQQYQLFARILILSVLFSGLTPTASSQSQTRPRARDLGVKVGVLPTGPLNAITDVAGVEVGHTTIIRGDDIRTGITAILPHGGNLFREKMPGAVFIGNAFGKLAGSTQIEELGNIETPILLTSTTAVPRVADALISYMLALPGNEDVLSINPVVGETNDGFLNDIRGRHITPEDREEREGRAGGRRCGRRWYRDHRVRLEGRDRHLVAKAAGEPGRIHRWRSGADEFRRHTHHCRRAGRSGTRPVLSQV
jgi:hypothetical protein